MSPPASPSADFARFVPGFDFLQQLAQQPSSSLAAAAQWVAPTLDPAEVQRRVHELKTVLFWLEQNTTALKATIHALEVQHMTLSALHTLHGGAAELAQAWSEAVHAPKDAQAAAPAAAAQGASASPEGAQRLPETEALMQTALQRGGQWWNALFAAFGHIAEQAQHDVRQQQSDFEARMAPPHKKPQAAAPTAQQPRPAPAPAAASSRAIASKPKPPAGQSATAKPRQDAKPAAKGKRLVRVSKKPL